MTTILPEAPPPRSPLAAARFALPRLRLVAYAVVAVLVGLGAATGARAWTSRLPGPDKPGGQELALTEWASLPASPTMPAWRIKLPREPRKLVPPEGGDAQMLMAHLGPGEGFPALFFGRFDGVGSAREATELIGRGTDLVEMGPVRETSVAGRRAWTRDMRFSGGSRVVHEYRFEIEGRVYGFGIVCRTGDDAGRDTGLAAMATFEVL